MLGRTHWIAMAAGAALVLVARTLPIAPTAVAGEPAPNDTLRTGALEIIGADGFVAARISSDDSGGFVQLFGPHGKPKPIGQTDYGFFGPRRLGETTRGGLLQLPPSRFWFRATPGERERTYQPSTPGPLDYGVIVTPDADEAAPRRGRAETTIWLLDGRATRP